MYGQPIFFMEESQSWILKAAASARSRTTTSKDATSSRPCYPTLRLTKYTSGMRSLIFRRERWSIQGIVVSWRTGYVQGILASWETGSGSLQKESLGVSALFDHSLSGWELRAWRLRNRVALGTDRRQPGGSASRAAAAGRKAPGGSRSSDPPGGRGSGPPP